MKPWSSAIVTAVMCAALAACGSSGSDSTIAETKPTPGLALIAGSAGGPGSVDGIGSAASFASSGGITADATGSLYVADLGNNTIRKITAAGVVTTLAGTAQASGSADGIGAAARFLGPSGIAADAAGNLYAADTYNHTIRRITLAGVVSTWAGAAGAYGSSDGTGAAARFNFPSDVTADAVGNLYVIDGNSTTIRNITPTGVVTTLAGTAQRSGSADGTGANARFAFPYCITADAAGVLYVTDNSAIRRITPDGTVTTIAGAPGVRGSVDGPAADARFNNPTGIVTDATGNLYVADSGNFTIRKITPGGVVTTVAGVAGVSGLIDGSGAAAQLLGPYHLAIDASGKLYVTDRTTIRSVTAAGVVTTLAGTARYTGTSDGVGAAARFTQPANIAADPAGNLYVVDRPSIRKITPSGVVSTLGGIQMCDAMVGPAVDFAAYSDLAGIATDAAGNLYLADPNCNTIAKITREGVVTTLAGATGIGGITDGNGPAARFSYPRGITADPAGNLYVVDSSAIRKITPVGVVTTLAGMPNAAGSADGSGTAARFYNPESIAADQVGNLYVADSFNRTIRKVTPEGVVTTVAGKPGVIGSADGTGSNASFNFPTAIAADAAGNVYVADRYLSVIRKVTPAGVVTTVAGVSGRSGIILGSLPGGLDTPLGVTLIDADTLAITTGASVVKAILR